MNTTSRFAANNASNTRRNNNQTGGVASRNGNTHHSNNHASGNRKPNNSHAAPSASAAASASGPVGVPSMESLESLKVSPTATIPTLDPTSQAGLMMVPVTKTYDTKGRTEFFQGLLKKEVSLCCLFQKGRCHAGDKCHQIHVEATFIKNVRAQNAHVISCCRACKDTASLSADSVTFFATHFGSEDQVKIVSLDGRYSTVKPQNVAITTGLIQHAEQLKAGQPMTSLPAKKMCRLHLRGACKYGKDCKNVHLCSKLGEAVLAPTHSPVPEERRSSVSSTGSSRVATPTPAPVSVASSQRRNSNSGIMDRASAATATVTTAPSTRRNSTASTVSSDAPKDYFSAQRFQTPPPMAVGALSRSGSMAPVPEEEDALAKGAHLIDDEVEVTTVPEKKRRLSFSQVDLSDVSFMEHSVQIPNLCFDPTLALSWDDVPKAMNNAAGHKKNQLSADWLVDDMASACGCSSTTSQKSHTPTPSKMAVW